MQLRNRFDKLVALTLLLLTEVQSTTDHTNCMTVWLTSIGLQSSKISEYGELFVREEVDQRALEGMSLGQLEALGINTMGPRTLIFNAAQSGIEVCKFGGVCEIADSAHSCTCKEGTSGPLCANVSSCVSDLCINGGICSEDNLQCLCPLGFTGDWCQTSVSCGNSPCVNDGTCEADSQGEYSCTCPLGYRGVNCETAWFSEEVFNNLENQLARLKSDVSVGQQLQLLQLNQISSLRQSDASLRQLLTEVNSPRLFTHWTDLISEEPIRDFVHLQIGSLELLATLTPSQVINIYLISQSGFDLLQTISLTADVPLGMESFSFDSQHCVVVAGGGSELFCWNDEIQMFEKTQDIFTIGAVDVKYLSTDDFHFLVFSCNGTGTNMASFVYLWSGLQFLLLQYLPTVGAVSVSAVSTSSAAFVAVTQRDWVTESEYTSMVFKWNGTHFNYLESFHSSNAFLFAAGEMVFLIHSGTLHRFDSAGSKFVSHSVLPDSTAVAYKHLHISTEHYLVVGKGLSEGNTTLTGSAEVYRLDGAGVEFHQTIEISGDVLALGGSDRRNFLAVLEQGNVVSFHKWSTSYNL